MGTNYYVEQTPCDKCGGGGEDLHIGKSSAGWKFLFQQHSEKGLNSRKAWGEFLHRPGSEIVDEYGVYWPVDDFFVMVDKKQSEKLTGLNCYSICGCSTHCATHNKTPSEFLDSNGFRISDGHEFS